MRSLPAAVYYFGIAARLGDVDAMYELGKSKKKNQKKMHFLSLLTFSGPLDLGYAYLNETRYRKMDRQRVEGSKFLAAQWLRAADKGGKRVVGESWIWKAKWGGPDEEVVVEKKSK
jgi:TPR repeat protein